MKANRAVLESTVISIAPIKAQLMSLCATCAECGEGRVSWEIQQAIAALDEAVELCNLYLSGAPLPTLEEMRGIYK